LRPPLTLDEDVAARLQAEARRTGRPFKVVVNEHLRAGLAQRLSATSAVAFRVSPVHMGAPIAGLQYDDISALLDEIEGTGRR